MTIIIVELQIIIFFYVLLYW